MYQSNIYDDLHSLTFSELQLKSFLCFTLGAKNSLMNKEPQQQTGGTARGEQETEQQEQPAGDQELSAEEIKALAEQQAQRRKGSTLNRIQLNSNLNVMES